MSYLLKLALASALTNILRKPTEYAVKNDNKFLLLLAIEIKDSLFNSFIE